VIGENFEKKEEILT